MRKLASKMMPTSEWYLEEGVLHSRVACRSAQTSVRSFEEGVVYFDDPNLHCAWEVQTFWIGDSLVTSERTPDGILNGGRPIIISRWVEPEGPRLVSRFEWATADGQTHETFVWDLATGAGDNPRTVALT